MTPEQVTNNKYKSSNSIQFMVESLKELNSELVAYGSKLHLYYGHYIDVLKEIINNHRVNGIYTNADYTPYAIKRDKDINNLCLKHNVKFQLSHDILLFNLGTVKNGTNQYYQKFTPFYNACMARAAPDKPKRINKIYMTKINNNKYSISLSDAKGFYKHNYNTVIGGRKYGLVILKNIIDFKTYAKYHDTLTYDTTHLSAYIKFGCVSIREVYHRAVHILGKKHPLIRQLIWREFYYHVGYGFISKFGSPLKPKYGKIKWSDNSRHIEAWKNGITGFPIVDAAMRELNITGFMHNRGRLIVGSFLVKNLLVNWKVGEQYFASKLTDYDVFVNNGNWQWVAGSGVDSQPYFRIFNPFSQSKEHDPDCEYIKKWIPELRNVPNQHIHEWDVYCSTYKNIYYPKPIIDFKLSKEHVIKAYNKALFEK